MGAEDRYITRLNQDFDWITVDKDRNMLEAAPTDWGTGVVVHAKEQRIMSKGVYKNSVEHKYSYSGMQYYTKAYGWSSTKNHVGMWFINPTIEYLSGGPTRLDLDAHFGDNGESGADHPRLLAQRPLRAARRSPIAAGEEWNKVVGPIFVYANSLDNPSRRRRPSSTRWRRPRAIRPCPRVGRRTRMRCGRTRRAGEKGKCEWPYRLGQGRRLHAAGRARQCDRARSCWSIRWRRRGVRRSCRT